MLSIRSLRYALTHFLSIQTNKDGVFSHKFENGPFFSLAEN